MTSEDSECSLQCFMVSCLEGHQRAPRRAAELSWESNQSCRAWLENSSASSRGRGALRQFHLRSLFCTSDKLIHCYFIFTSGQKWEYRFFHRLYFLTIHVLVFLTCMSQISVLSISRSHTLWLYLYFYLYIECIFKPCSVLLIEIKCMWKSIKRIF